MRKIFIYLHNYEIYIYIYLHNYGIHLINKPAASELRSEIKHAASDESTQEVWGETRAKGERFSPFPECSRHLLSALFLNGARLKLVYLFYNIELLQFYKKLSLFIKNDGMLTAMKKRILLNDSAVRIAKSVQFRFNFVTSSSVL